METFPDQMDASDPTFGDPSPFDWRPMLLVTIFGHTNRLDTIGLVDTGAVETVIPLDYRDEVEPLFRDGEEIALEAANGSTISMRYGTVDLATRVDGEVYRWSAKVGFSNDRDELVLGDLGFLRHLAIKFDRAARRLMVRDPVDLSDSFVQNVPTDELPHSYPDVHRLMKSQREGKTRPKPRRRPPGRGGG